VFLTHQGDNVFLAWFTYDLDGSPMWLVGSNIVKTGNLTYSGTLYRTTGPPFTESPWRSANVSATAVGTATLVFQEVGATTFTYTVGGVSGRKFIGRQHSRPPHTLRMTRSVIAPSSACIAPAPATSVVSDRRACIADCHTAGSASPHTGEIVAPDANLVCPPLPAFGGRRTRGKLASAPPLRQ
jgi:hypothetical protein